MVEKRWNKLVINKNSSTLDGLFFEDEKTEPHTRIFLKTVFISYLSIIAKVNKKIKRGVDK